MYAFSNEICHILLSGHSFDVHIILRYGLRESVLFCFFYCLRRNSLICVLMSLYIWLVVRFTGLMLYVKMYLL